VFGVAPICRALSQHYDVAIAPRSYYAWRVRGPSKRALWDFTITEILAGIYVPDAKGRRPPECLYGATKMWAHLQRQGIPVARCTVERLMQANGWAGVLRTKKVRTTIADPAADRAKDLVNRNFTTAAPNLLLVTDFTYVPIPGRFVFTAFVIDAFAGVIPGWDVTNAANNTMVRRALADAVQTRRRQGHPIEPGAIHHSDSEYERAGVPRAS
jgi:putative transposase